MHKTEKQFMMTEELGELPVFWLQKKGYRVCYLSGSLQKSWQFPGRDGKAAVYAMCPQKSEKERYSLGEALNPAVSAAVPAFCRFVFI